MDLFRDSRSFTRNLLATCLDYGRLDDGREALVLPLETALIDLGMDGQAVVQDVLNGLRRVAALPDVEPYRGLEAFDREHARYYFGREDDVQRLVAMLDQQNFIAVVGPSGSGKSSLVRAGLATTLLNGSGRWRIEFFKPGDDPLRALRTRCGFYCNRTRTSSTGWSARASWLTVSATAVCQ